MIREGNVIYINDKVFRRSSKMENYENKEIIDVKKEINRLKFKIFKLEKNRDKNKEEIKELEEELSFWKNEMNKFDNIPSRKKLKAKTRKLSYDNLKKIVLEHIESQKSKGQRYISKENISFEFNIKIKDLDKLFMELNREGIISQGKNRYIHDSIRGGNYPILPYESSDWGCTLYEILRKED